jgi:hypothetical protein
VEKADGRQYPQTRQQRNNSTIQDATPDCSPICEIRGICGSQRGSHSPIPNGTRDTGHRPRGPSALTFGVPPSGGGFRLAFRCRRSALAFDFPLTLNSTPDAVLPPQE